MMLDQHMNHDGILKPHTIAKIFLLLLLLCNLVYIVCRVFRVNSYVLEEEQHDGNTSSLRIMAIDNARIIEAMGQERKLPLANVCNGYRDVDQTAEYIGTIPRVITVDQNHPILYCPIQKVASTFWVRVLTALGSKGKYKSPFDLTLKDKTLTSFRSLRKEMTSEQTDEYVSNLFSFMFVRDPYSRLYSAYIDKVYYPNVIFWPNLINEILSEVYGKEASAFSISHVTFAEFIKYILNMHEEGKTLDKHFAPMHTLCDPCKIKYSYLGRLESFVSDMNYLFGVWNDTFVDFNLSFTDFSWEAMLDDTTSHVSMLFTVADQMKNSSDSDIYRIIQRGWINMQLRGYIDKDSGLPFTQDAIRELTMDSFMTYFKKIASHTPLDRQKAKQQRTEALEQAYRSVSMKDLERLRLFVLEDCKLFGYDDRPGRIFQRDYKVSEHDYLPDIHHISDCT